MLTQPNILRSFLYLHMAEPMPEPVLDSENEIDVAADNAAIEAWALAPEPTAAMLQMQDRILPFIVQTGRLLTNLEELELDPNEPAGPQYMTLFYDTAKVTFDYDKSQLRTYFAWLYLVLFQRPEGPRWGDFVEIYGVDNFVALARRRFGELIDGPETQST